VVSLTNEIVYKSTPTEAFATVFFAILDRRSGLLTYSNAGHTTAAIVGPDGSVERREGNGPLVGAFEGVEFGESEAHLWEGDLLFLYTDGVTEARRGREQYGEARLFALLESMKGLSNDIVGDVVTDVVSFSEGMLRDDVAILAISKANTGLTP